MSQELQISNKSFLDGFLMLICFLNFPTLSAIIQSGFMSHGGLLNGFPVG